MDLALARVLLYQSLDFQRPEKLLQCAQQLFGETVYLMDGNFNSMLSQQAELVEQVRQHIVKLRPMQRLTAEHTIAELQSAEGFWLIGAVYRQNLPVIITAICRDTGPWGEESKQLCETLLDTLNLWLSAQSPRNMLYRKTSSTYINFFIELLNGKLTNYVSLKKRLAQMSIVQPKEFCILVIDMELQQSNEIALFLVAEFITELLRCPMFCFYEDKLTFLVDTIATPPWNEKIASQVEDRLRRFSSFAACSLSCSDLLQVAAAYMDAQKTLELGRRLHPTESLYKASDYMTYIMIDIVAGRLTITKSINHALLTLQDYDRQHNTNLFQTLYVYLKHLKDPNAAATQLHIHRSTFFYRMNVIRDLLKGVPLDDGELVMQLMLSYHIMFFNGLIEELPM